MTKEMFFMADLGVDLTVSRCFVCLLVCLFCVCMCVSTASFVKIVKNFNLKETSMLHLKHLR